MGRPRIAGSVVILGLAGCSPAPSNLEMDASQSAGPKADAARTIDASADAGTGPSDASDLMAPPDAGITRPLSVRSGAATHLFDVEVADTPAERARGLMFRTALAPDAGMIFLFPDSDVRSFWMKDTLIELDMIFIDANHVVVGIVHRAEPLTTTPRTVGVPSQFVLELVGGRSMALGIVTGDEVLFDFPLPDR